QVAEAFLQTAIVIDDQAQFGAVVTVGPTSPVVVPSTGIIEEAATTPEPAAPAAEPSVTVTLEHEPSAASAKLDAKTLSEAFLAKRMICGLYRPSSGEDMVQKSVGVARIADVVVVDWHLVEGSSRQAK
ncbi:response regulator receiver domain, partial [Klebsiella pneumoniae]|uniref:response regulator receiver domain n=1 Tax=Klebsiella pneumoniae TaxID=573 RepID=UPI001C5D36C0